MAAWTSIFDFILIPTFTEETVGLLGFFCGPFDSFLPFNPFLIVIYIDT